MREAEGSVLSGLTDPSPTLAEAFVREKALKTAREAIRRRKRDRRVGFMTWIGPSFKGM